mmetsp:Transcript_72961/g.193893  ORF Transcript_72961/g.193893 Transcript_72961/m.193893 type:complete len:208 (-) Transcript_72961:251-874(-)
MSLGVDHARGESVPASSPSGLLASPLSSCADVVLMGEVESCHWLASAALTRFALPAELDGEDVPAASLLSRLRFSATSRCSHTALGVEPAWVPAARAPASHPASRAAAKRPPDHNPLAGEPTSLPTNPPHKPTSITTNVRPLQVPHAGPDDLHRLLPQFARPRRRSPSARRSPLRVHDDFCPDADGGGSGGGRIGGGSGGGGSRGAS